MRLLVPVFFSCAFSPKIVSFSLWKLYRLLSMRSLQLAWITATLSISAFLNLPSLVSNLNKTQLLNSSKYNVNLIMLLQFWNSYIGYLCILELSSKFFSMFLIYTVNNLAPSYLSDQLYPYNPTRNLRSGDQRLLSVPRSQLKSTIIDLIAQILFKLN